RHPSEHISLSYVRPAEIIRPLTAQNRAGSFAFLSKRTANQHGRGTSLVGVADGSERADEGFRAPAEGIAGQHRFLALPEGSPRPRLVEGITAGSIVADAPCPCRRLDQSLGREAWPNEPAQLPGRLD